MANGATARAMADDIGQGECAQNRAVSRNWGAPVDPTGLARNPDAAAR
jgi:hypothetical protein